MAMQEQQHIEPNKNIIQNDGELSPGGGPDRATTKKALLKLDAFLLSTVTIFYWLSFLDRSNIGNAKNAGLQTDLKLTSHQYSVALTVTYVPYIVAELPLTLAMRTLGPHRLLPTLVATWGLVATLQGES
ncbi:MAG: hypothetical protein CYPHOPRED_003029 [Cyphobasidiales sp. Tagirdzhanova-0007]|nr:MAG: hypothetical protein CYPHOPRED_003029 [Cyphobasidiales sp. Tagirdzhanova-0007]